MQPPVSSSREGVRVGSSMMKSSRQANFRKFVRKEAVHDAKKQKDEETRRMEEYRKLCKKEGITSQRLKDYDELKIKASHDLDARLEALDQDQSLTNAEKRKRKFSLKQKQAGTTVADLAAKNKKPAFVSKLDKIRETREAERKAISEQRAQCAADKERKMKARKDVNNFHRQKTRKGQPVMSGKISALMAKIERQ